jgi:hypothetical protein
MCSYATNSCSTSLQLLLLVSLPLQFQQLVRKARMLPSDPKTLLSLFTMPACTVHGMELGPSGEGLMGAVGAAVASLLSDGGSVVPTADSLALFDINESLGAMEPAFEALRVALSTCAVCLRPPGVPVLFPSSISEWRAALADMSAALMEASRTVDPLEASELPRPRGSGQAGSAVGVITLDARRCRDVAQWLGSCAAPELTASTIKCREAAEIALTVYSEVCPIPLS